MVCAMPITYAGLAGIAELTGQEWPTALAELLAQMHVAVQTAKQGGATALPARRLATFVKNYDALIAEGNTLNPPPPPTGKRGRPARGQYLQLKIHWCSLSAWAEQDSRY